MKAPELTRRSLMIALSQQRRRMMKHSPIRGVGGGGELLAVKKKQTSRVGASGEVEQRTVGFLLAAAGSRCIRQLYFPLRRRVEERSAKAPRC